MINCNENDNEKNIILIGLNVDMDANIENIACLCNIMSICNKQHLSNILSSIH